MTYSSPSQFDVHEHLMKADLPPRPTPAEEEEYAQHMQNFHDALNRRDETIRSQSGSRGAIRSGTIEMTPDGPLTTVDPKSIKPAIIGPYDHETSQAVDDVEFHDILAQNSDYAKKDRAFGDALAKHFSQFPHMGIQKHIANYKRGIITSNDLHRSILEIASNR